MEVSISAFSFQDWEIKEHKLCNISLNDVEGVTQEYLTSEYFLFGISDLSHREN